MESIHTVIGNQGNRPRGSACRFPNAICGIAQGCLTADHTVAEQSIHEADSARQTRTMRSWILGARRIQDIRSVGWDS
jgi:hypothetical protein